MSRLYEALSKATAERYQRGAARTTGLTEMLLPSPIPAEPTPEPTTPSVADGEMMAKSHAVVVDTSAKSDLLSKIDSVTSVVGKPPTRARLVAWSEPNSLGAEKFRALVTRLDHIRSKNKLKSLQVTSSVVNEGKSLVAANVAVTLSKYLGAKTLLVEGDLHRPTLMSLFGLGGLRGMTQWWSGPDADITHFLHRFNGTPLWFLAAGASHEQPSQMLSSTKFAVAFSQLATCFDWVVVDSTPMLPIIDVNLWSRLLDGTLLVVREGVAPVKALKEGLRSLDHPKLLGVVLNEASTFGRLNYEGHYYGAPKSRSVPTTSST